MEQLYNDVKTMKSVHFFSISTSLISKISVSTENVQYKADSINVISICAIFCYVSIVYAFRLKRYISSCIFLMKRVCSPEQNSPILFASNCSQLFLLHLLNNKT